MIRIGAIDIWALTTFDSLFESCNKYYGFIERALLIAMFDLATIEIHNPMASA